MESSFCCYPDMMYILFVQDIHVQYIFFIYDSSLAVYISLALAIFTELTDCIQNVVDEVFIFLLVVEQ